MNICWWKLFFTIVWIIHSRHIRHVVHVRRWICLWRLVSLRNHVTRIMHWWRLLIHSRIGWNVRDIWDWWNNLLCWWIILESSWLSFIRFFWRYRLTDKFLSLANISISLEHSFSVTKVFVLQNNLLIKQQGDLYSFIT